MDLESVASDLPLARQILVEVVPLRQAMCWVVDEEHQVPQPTPCRVQLDPLHALSRDAAFSALLQGCLDLDNEAQRLAEHVDPPGGAGDLLRGAFSVEVGQKGLQRTESQVANIVLVAKVVLALVLGPVSHGLGQAIKPVEEHQNVMDVEVRPLWFSCCTAERPSCSAIACVVGHPVTPHPLNELPSEPLDLPRKVDPVVVHRVSPSRKLTALVPAAQRWDRDP